MMDTELLEVLEKFDDIIDSEFVEQYEDKIAELYSEDEEEGDYDE